jgi:hypothetical protein
MNDPIDWAALKGKREKLAGCPDEQLVEHHIENWHRRLQLKEPQWEETLDLELLDLLQKMQTAL